MNIKLLVFLVFLFFFALNLSAQSLNIVSWNLKDFGQSRDDEEIELIAEQLRDADVVAIQEVVAKHPGGAKAVARLASELNNKGSNWDYSISNPTKSSSPYQSERYAFLWKKSKVSVTDGGPRLVRELAIQVEREPYRISLKNKSGKVITIVNYHACTHKKDFPERTEINSISNWLLVQNFENIIWAGDMNLKITDQAFKSILASEFSSVLNGEKTSLKTKCIGGNYLSRAEDNVLYKLSNWKFNTGNVLDFIKIGNCEEVEWKRVSYSDHLGVMVTIE